MLKNLEQLFFFSVCYMVLMISPSFGQSGSTQKGCGGITGRTTTIEGYVIPGTKIRLANKSTKQVTNTFTDGDGEYTICLEAGTYDVSTKSLGFKNAIRKSIKIDKSGKNTIDFVLKHGKPVVNNN
ncbi:MAG: carboxypeptidase-like regulatory domain-containing protein [Pyrinomonadaceae bacterium]